MLIRIERMVGRHRLLVATPAGHLANFLFARPEDQCAQIGAGVKHPVTRIPSLVQISSLRKVTRQAKRRQTSVLNATPPEPPQGADAARCGFELGEDSIGAASTCRPSRRPSRSKTDNCARSLSMMC